MSSAGFSQNLYLDHLIEPATQRQLDEWTRVVESEPPLPPARWHLRVGNYIRHAAIGASTRIEGNALDVDQAHALLEGQSLPGVGDRDRTELFNYRNAAEMAATMAQDSAFQWTEMVPRLINAAVMRDLEDDSHGRYRTQPVYVGARYQAPDATTVPRYMALWVEWLRTTDWHPLVRAALLHLNLVAIHPWMNGNGRTARLLSSLELMRVVSAPELIAIEVALLERQDDYFARIREAVGPTYQPDTHSVTEWVAWYVGLHAVRLQEGHRLLEAVTYDMGSVISALERRNDPIEWGPALHLAAFGPITTSQAARLYGGRESRARSVLRRMVAAGWLERSGRTSDTSYHASPRLEGLNLRTRELALRLARGHRPAEQLELPIPDDRRTDDWQEGEA